MKEYHYNEPFQTIVRADIFILPHWFFYNLLYNWNFKIYTKDPAACGLYVHLQISFTDMNLYFLFVFVTLQGKMQQWNILLHKILKSQEAHENPLHAITCNRNPCWASHDMGEVFTMNEENLIKIQFLNCKSN